MRETKERVTEWLTSPDSSFLIGAGCSRCAGKPLIGELTNRVLDAVDETIKTEFDGLKKTGIRPPTIEDLINYLVRYQFILKTVENTNDHHLQPDWIEQSLQSIKKEIVDQIADSWVESQVHARFLQRIGSSRSDLGRDVFTLNYDTVIEATLDHLMLHYTDGFRGSRNGWFDPTVFDETPASQLSFRLYKLHGSINWRRENTGHVRRIVARPDQEVDDPVVVYPSEQKYVQTQFGIYETLIGRFRDRLRRSGVNNRLVTLGYSFNDEHINEAIIDAVCSSSSNLTVIALVGPDSDLNDQKLKLEALGSRCNQRFNAYVGDSFFVGGALDEADAKNLLKENLWKFENLVDYIAGAIA